MKKVVPNFSGNVALISAKAGKNFFVLAFVLLISLAGFAHSVDSYAASCGAGPQYTVTATISNVNSTSNYRWQWKNSAGAWVCFVNGANTINGTAYNVSGAVYNLTTVPGPIVFTNPSSGLQGLEIRMVISDGNGVDPCTLPAGNTWTSTTNHFINVNNTPCGASTCNGRVTNLYFNELNNGPDLPITNGSTFTVAQLASLYNLEAGTSGTIGSVKYTITGPTPTSNIENTTPYNSPGTGSGAWTGAVGTYTVNLKTYSAADATGNLCHDTTITFNLTTSCIPTTTVIAPLAGVTCTNTFEYNVCQSSCGQAISHWVLQLPACFSSSNISAVYLNNQLYSNWTVGTDPTCNVFGLKVDNPNIDGGTCKTIKIVFTTLLTVGTNNWTAKIPTNCFSGGSIAAPASCTACTANNGSIGDRVWLDANGNGLQDATETGGITGVTVQLRNSANTVIATQTTNGSGNYLFTGLAAGTYTVVFPVSLAGSVVTTANVGSDDNIDSDPSQTTGITPNIVLAAGQNITNVDAGYCPVNLQLGNRVWYDTNNNGINDAAENGIRNVTVYLYKDDNNDNVADGASIATLVTDVNGNYTFSNLAPGNYIVGAVIPAGYMSSSINGGDPDNNTDLDDNGQVVSGTEISGLAITLTGGAEPTSGNTNNTYDFGMLPDCNCTTSGSNLLVNGSFENGTTGWSWSGGTLTTGTGYIACGAANGFNNWSSGTAKVWQDVTIVPGATATFSGFAGTHTPGLTCTPQLNLIFLNASNTIIGQSNVSVTRDVDVNFGQLEYYSITAVAPAGATKVRVQNSITCNTLKIDAFCLTVTLPASIGDRVWKDDNANGIQDAGEVGLSGITLVLLNSSGQVVATTTTDAFGNYKFSNLAPGNYSIRITPPANYTLSAKDQGGDDNTDSDFDQTTYTTASFNLSAGQNRTDVDAGFKFSQPTTASVGDRVWLDINTNGTQDAGEPGVSNVLVTLYNSGGVAVVSTYSDANGYYLFTDVTPGTYTVGVSLPPAMVFTNNNGTLITTNNSDINPANGRTTSFTVNAGDQITYVDAGIKTQQTTNGSVGDFVWNDVNKNGVQDAGEPGIAGVTVRLINTTTNTTVATTTTDATGKYIFNDVIPANYLVEFVTPTGYTPTTKLNASPVTAGTDSDADIVTGRTGSFTLVAGQRITTIDAGYWVTTPLGTGKIGDRVWHDANQNGVQDAGEPGIAGVTVTLYNAGGTAIMQATTDQNGNYIFTDLAAGNYTVGFSNLPADFTFTTAGAGTAATGSDANPATGRTATIVLAAGQINLDVDAGIRAAQAGTASMGNKVWYDLNNNGLQDNGEIGVAGVTVELLDAAGNAVDKDPVTAGVQPTTTITNGVGEYLFTGLAAGDYKVRFSTLPAGYTVVAKAAGTDRNIDSDGNALIATTSTTDVVSLSAGQERLDIDLGIFNATAPVGQLGDRVWFDANNNGVQDGGEQGMPGVSVALLDATGVTIRTTVTDKDGIYKFINLADGTYSVQFSNLPAGFTFSGKDLGGNDATDSDADPLTGKTGNYTISGGNTNTTVDAGIYSTRAALGDYVWFDANKDGIQDATESGIPGVTVILYDAAGAAVASTVTDQSGRYFFSNLNAGTYTVGFSTIPAKLVFTTQDVVAAGDAADSDVNPATGKTGSVTLVAGQVNLTVDAGLKPVIPATIGDFVWFDLDRDGIQDAGEPGVPGIVVTIYNSSNQAIGSAVSDGNGYYLITNVPPGTGYYVTFGNKPDAAAPWTTQNVGGVAALNNSKVDATGKTGTFNVTEGQNISNIDAGLTKLINLRGNVWHDVNALSDNLVNNSGGALVPPAAEIPVGLRAYLVNEFGVVVKSTFIDVDGTYQFSNITPNTYYTIVLTFVSVSVGSLAPQSLLPSGWNHTGQKLGITAGSDGVNDGVLEVNVGTSDVINANFGIRIQGGEVVIG